MLVESETVTENSSLSESKARESIVVALDVDNATEALSLVNRLGGRVGMFKIGKQLFTSEGPALVRKIVEKNEKVFLDLKYHDIPNTVAGAAAAATKLGVSIFNVHASGGRSMLEAAVQASKDQAQRQGTKAPLVLGVTVLTSIDAETLTSLGIEESPEKHVLRLAKLAKESGLDGVVASPLEIRSIRKHLPTDFVVLTPGIRPAERNNDDQRRTSSPAEALRAGANYLVVGRPITAAPDPVSALEKIIAEIRVSG